MSGRMSLRPKSILSRAVTCVLGSLLSVVIGACGGGSSSEPAATMPAITTQPADTSVAEGSIATLSVVATGTAPLTYQWSSSADGVTFVSIAGAIAASYVTGAATPAQDGTHFRVVVSNSAGSVTSSPVLLTVISLANVRLLNATVTHPNLALLSNSAPVLSSVAIDTVSNFVSVDSGSPPTLQINDADTGTTLATVIPILASGDHYAVVAYDSGGLVRTAVIPEDNTAPASGAAILRIFVAATDAGAIDVYVTDPTTDLSAVTSPTFSFNEATQAQAGVFQSFTPGIYRVRVVGSGDIADVRLDIPAVVLANQQLATVFLTPTTGGTLVNGGVLLQQGAYTATHNRSARIRLAAAVSNSAAVSVWAGTSAVGTGAVSPAVGAYTTVDSGSALNIIVNGRSVAAPPGTLAAGSDSTLVVYGNPSAPTTNLITDDNHDPADPNNYKIRLLNGLTGSNPPPLTLDANFSVVANNVLPGTASTYSVIPASTSTELDVFSPTQVSPGYTSANSSVPLSIPGIAVYTLFILGDTSAPVHLLRKDR